MATGATVPLAAMPAAEVLPWLVHMLTGHMDVAQRAEWWAIVSRTPEEEAVLEAELNEQNIEQLRAIGALG